jgi:hypothetical protein
MTISHDSLNDLRSSPTDLAPDHWAKVAGWLAAQNVAVVQVGPRWVGLEHVPQSRADDPVEFLRLHWSSDVNASRVFLVNATPSPSLPVSGRRALATVVGRSLACEPLIASLENRRQGPLEPSDRRARRRWKPGSTARLLDHLIRPLKQRLRDRQAE